MERDHREVMDKRKNWRGGGGGGERRGREGERK